MAGLIRSAQYFKVQVADKPGELAKCKAQGPKMCFLVDGDDRQGALAVH